MTGYAVATLYLAAQQKHGTFTTLIGFQHSILGIKFPPVNVKGKEERAERAKSRRKRQIQQQLKEAAEKRKCIDEPGEPVYEINFSGDDLDADTLNSDEKQEGTVDETEAVSDEQQLQRESTNQKQFMEKSSQTDEFDYLFTCSHEFTQTFEESEFKNDDERVSFYTGLPSFDILMSYLGVLLASQNFKSL